MYSKGTCWLDLCHQKQTPHEHCRPTHALCGTMSDLLHRFVLRMLPSTTSGKIPAQLGELSKLEKLDLWDNFLEGEPLLSRKQRFARRSFWRNIRETGSVHTSERKADRRQRVRKVRSILEIKTVVDPAFSDTSRISLGVWP